MIVSKFYDSQAIDMGQTKALETVIFAGHVRNFVQNDRSKIPQIGHLKFSLHNVFCQSVINSLIGLLSIRSGGHLISLISLTVVSNTGVNCYVEGYAN